VMRGRNPIEVLTGIVVLIVAIGFLGYAISNAGTGPSGGGYPLYASFDNIAGLNVGSDVRVAGVKVGSVQAETIDPKTYLARVTLDVRQGIQLPKDSSISVSSESLLGGVYLAISPGGDEQMLKPGDSFTAAQGAISLQDLLGKFIFSASNMASAMGGASGQSGGNQSGGNKPAAAAPAAGGTAR
jgi:phospholipid/cholesterol/gamma-HCH transport system substrate-binding protein